MAISLEQKVRLRAAGRCEYCRISESNSRLPHVLDHIIARQHRGQAILENLALCCGRCNQFKGPNIAGLDPESGVLTALYHPRQDQWADHFRWDGVVLIGKTNIGRTTVEVLSINHPLRVAARHRLLIEGTNPTDAH